MIQQAGDTGLKFSLKSRKSAERPQIYGNTFMKLGVTKSVTYSSLYSAKLRILKRYIYSPKDAAVCHNGSVEFFKILQVNLYKDVFLGMEFKLIAS